jgi:hypothetical protein
VIEPETLRQDTLQSLSCWFLAVGPVHQSSGLSVCLFKLGILIAMFFGGGGPSDDAEFRVWIDA